MLTCAANAWEQWVHPADVLVRCNSSKSYLLVWCILHASASGPVPTQLLTFYRPGGNSEDNDPLDILVLMQVTLAPRDVDK